MERFKGACDVFQQAEQQYNEHADEEHSEGLCIRMLHQATTGCKSLNHVKDTYETATRASGTGAKLTYDECLNRLIAAAQVEDAQNGSIHKNPHNQVNRHSFEEEDEEVEECDDGCEVNEHDFNTPVDTFLGPDYGCDYEVNYNDQHRQGGSNLRR